jgi:hypothetical protein
MHVRGGNRMKIAMIMALPICFFQEGSIGGRPDLSISKRKIRHGQTGVLVSHGRSKNQLEKDQNRSRKKRRTETPVEIHRVATCNQSAPRFRQAESDRGNQKEKDLRKRRVKNAQLILIERHPESTEQALNANQQKSNDSKPAQPAPFVFQPKPDCENRSEEADR